MPKIVLIVDDDEHLREILAAMLRFSGYEISQAATSLRLRLSANDRREGAGISPRSAERVGDFLDRRKILRLKRSATWI
jgi:DNA-binding NtrC family response regulator